ncbi:MAG: hypothetical protein U9O85_03700 [Euryarchaeota archaeon]|nr:hypothetical protein [Euryarchaeota archaeon]
MDAGQSGKELCNRFFDALKDRDDVDQKVVKLLSELYFEDNLTKEDIIQGLKTLRGERDE